MDAHKVALVIDSYDKGEVTHRWAEPQHCGVEPWKVLREETHPRGLWTDILNMYGVDVENVLVQ